MNIKSLTDRRLKELYYENYTYKQIAEMYECSIGHVSRKVNKLIKEEYITKRINVTKLLVNASDNINNNCNVSRRATYEEIMVLYEMKVPVKEISKLLDISTDTIYKAIRKYKMLNNIPLQKSQPVDKAYILELYNKEFTYKQISRLSNVCLQTVFRIVNEAIFKGIVSDRKYNKLNMTDKKLIIMYRNNMSIEDIARELRDAKKILEDKIIYFTNKKIILEENTMKNIFVINKGIINRSYMNGISCENIAWSLKIPENMVKEYIESNKIIQNKTDIIQSMIQYNNPKEISNILSIPIDMVYLHLKDVI